MHKKSGLRSVRGLGLTVVLAVVLGVAPASAQAAQDGFSLGLASGFVRGSDSPFSRGGIGYYALGNLELPRLFRVFRPRIDGMFADWGSERLESLTANMVFTPVSGRKVAPYLVAGAGAYAATGKVQPGWNLGAGLRLPGELRALTVETRLHVFRRTPQSFPNIVGYSENRWRTVWAPIGFGIQF
ncbi:MAG: hypothetical protein ACJ77R_04340 [Gemmatimonadaceae bacterium]